MRERGDLTVLHEPFMYHHYLNASDRVFPDFVPEPGHPTSYKGIRAMIRAKAKTGPVFFKDMAYYVTDALPDDTGFAEQLTHAFLLRDPTEAALSYARRDPDFTCFELGHAAQHQLYKALVDMGHSPLVLTADQLRHDPESTLRRYWTHAGLPFTGHAFEWDDRLPDGWQSVKTWHKEVLSSSAIHPPEDKDATGELSELGAPYTGYAAYHAPHYETLRAVAETQASQWGA